MAESKELETLVYCLGPVGGKENPVATKGSKFSSKHDYTTNGYARYIEEANNVVKFQYLIINYFLESVKSDFEEDPLAFIDAEIEDIHASIQKMKKKWRDMFKEHQKKLRESLRNQRQASEQSLDESSGSSAKIPRLDPEKTSKADSTDSESTVGAGASGVPVESVEFPESIFLRKVKEFGRVLKVEYQELRARMGKALDRISRHDTIHDLKGFTLQKMEKFAKWKYDLKTLDYLIPELESQLNELDLDFEEIKENETRLTEWMYFDDGKSDRKYHHRLLIPMELAVSVDEISALLWRQIRRWKKISKSLANKLPVESEAFEEKVELWKRAVTSHSPSKRPLKAQKSAESTDSLFNVEDMPDET